MTPNFSPAGRSAWLYRGLVVLFLVGLAVPILFRKPADWQKVYVAAAERLRSGLDIYEWNTTSYVYPPLGAWLAVPFADLPPAVGKAAWAAVTVLAGFVLLRGAWRLTGTAAFPGMTRSDRVAVWLGAACAAGFALDVAGNHQTDLVIAALMVLGCERLARDRSVAAGVLFGLAAALKCTPLLWAPYLAWRRMWAGAAAVVVVAVGANLLPDLAYPPPGSQPRLVVWATSLLRPITAKDFDPGMWASGPGFNHSVAGVANRWLTADRVELNGWSLAVPRADRPSTAELKRVVWAAQAALVLLAVVALWRKPSREGAPQAAEFGAVLTLMLLLSPMSSKPHFCTLLVPQLLLARLGWARRDRLLIGLTVLAAVLGLVANKDVVGRRAYEWLLWNGAVFANCLVLFLGCCYARRRYASDPQREMMPAAAPTARAA